MNIMNLTQHSPTVDQIEDGVLERTPELEKEIQSLLTFESQPTKVELVQRAVSLAALCLREEAKHVMIGGAPYLMRPLEEALEEAEVKFVYGFSHRVFEEVLSADGSSMEKRMTFKHLGFI